MPPKRKKPPIEGTSSAIKRPKKTPIVDQLIIDYGDVQSIHFEPFRPEQIRPAHALLPSTFPTEPLPSDYLNLFLTPDLFDIITRNTNTYVANQRLNKEERVRAWHPLNSVELQVFIGVIIYMGVHREPDINWYWNTEIAKGPIHSIPSYLSLRRFEQIKRYLHISCIESDKSLGYDQPDNQL